jgi:integrase
MSPTIAVILDRRREKQSEKYPVKLRVTFERVTKYYQTTFDLSKQDWEKLPASRVSSELQIMRSKLKEIERDALAAIQKVGRFNFADFEKHFIQSSYHFKKRKLKIQVASNESIEFDYDPYQKKFAILRETPGEPGSISYSYTIFIKKLIREGRISTAKNYHCSYVSLKKFRGDVSFEIITVSFLTEYENWLKSSGVSKTTVGIYLRPLRTIFNEANEVGIIRREKHYPFGKRKYRIPSSRNIKKALELSDVQKIFYYESSALNEEMARDYWLFSYFANGMNPKDIANLRHKDIDGDYIIFERSKTENSLRRDPRPITVYLTDDIRAIIDKWGNKNRFQNDYLFPVLEHGLNPLRQYELIQNFVHFINDHMKQILKNIGIDKKATTYVARHTFSTVLKRSGASTEFIQEALGHTDLKTTENYLDSFDKETKKEYAKRLVSFKETHQLEPELITK